MTRSFFKFTFLGAVSLLAATQAVAQPAAATSVIPPWIPLVGMVAGAPDAFGTRVVVVNDPFGAPIPGALVTIDYSACCDINLCTAPVAGQVVTCPFFVSGLTDFAGTFTFTVLGAAKDPGTSVPPASYGGPGMGAVIITADDLVGSGPIVLGTASSFVLDQNGAAGGSDGTTVADVANLLNLVGAVFLGAPYRARGDLNADGMNSVADIASQFQHVGRLALTGGTGCGAPFCAKPACP